MISVRYKAFLPVGILAVLLALMGMLATAVLTQQEEVSRQLVERFHRIELVREIELDVNRLVHPHLSYITTYQSSDVERIEQLLASIEKKRAGLLRTTEADDGADWQKLLDELSVRLRAIRDLSASLLATPSEHHHHAMMLIDDLASSHIQPLSEFLFAWRATQASDVDRLGKLSGDQTSRFLVVTKAAAVTLLFLIIFALWLNNRVLVKPIVAIIEEAQQLAAGHLDKKVSVKSNDELGRLAGDINHMAASLAAMYEHLETLANTDQLTGLLNRRAFDLLAAKEFALAKRHGHHLAIAVLDIDHFKRVNDEYGHHFGDAVLRDLAQRLLAVLRESDYCFRYGGEEFVLVFRKTPPDALHALLERCRELVERTPFESQGVSKAVTVSIGAACFPNHADLFDDLVKMADQSMYRAKRAGRNCVVLAEASSATTAQEARNGAHV